jgi:cytochrome P450
VNFRS